MKLIPVIELEPYTFSKIDRKCPDSKDACDWDSQWKESLSDSGINNIEPIVKGTWFVDINKINQENLKLIISIILNEALENYCKSLPLVEQIGPLCGGYILSVNTTTCILPSCCGDLSNIINWEEAIDYIGEDEKELWIGHPWLYVMGNKDQIILRQTAEYGKPSKPEKLSVNRITLKNQIKKARAILTETHHRILPIIAEIHPKEAEEITRVLLYGHEQI